MKRLMDILFAAAGLALSSPVLLVVIFSIWKQDRHSPFYIAPRVGKREQLFRMVKLRSMIVGADKTGVDSTSATDSRITPVGHFVRRFKLDEITQLWNVLKGEMSLVGPRPVLQDEIIQYYKECVDYYHMVRPGITGLWQVSGRNNVGYDVRVRLDAWYVLNWSLWLDIVILFRTIRVVLNKEGAY